MLFRRDYPPYRWITAREVVSLVKGICRLDAYPGQIFSFFPLSETVEQMRSTGLKWPLNDLVWTVGQAGISNVATEEVVTVTVGKGKLLAVKELF